MKLLSEILKKIAALPSLTSKDSQEIMRNISLYPNIGIVTYKASFIDHSNNPIKKKGVLAVNTELCSTWQVECHLITRFNAQIMVELEIDDQRVTQ